MTDKFIAELDRIMKLHEAATEGPWKRSDETTSDNLVSIYSKPKSVETARVEEWDDATFIADSRTSVPKMERLIRAQARVIEALRYSDRQDTGTERSRVALQTADEAESALAELKKQDGWV